jgi:DNA-binding CsgD family transcriptional regulator/tetratricopeptide (TPR) repeat protein
VSRENAGITVSRLVGRAAELSELLTALNSAKNGAGRIVLLSGDAGIGKSRLAAEVVAAAQKGNIAVLLGRGHALHAGLAYAPIVEALRPHLAALPDAEADQLLHGLADLGRLLPHPRLPAPDAPSDSELERTRMFEAVALLIGRIARQTGVLLFVDDIHWADRGTIELLHYVGSTIADQRVLLLVTYRSSEVEGPLGELALAVRRNNPDADHTLAPLSDTAVADLTRDLLGTDPAAELLKNVTARAKGVPLFVTALVHSGPGRQLRPDRLPAIVRDVVVGRLHRLGEGQRRLLETVAVAGNSGTDDVLWEVWNGERDDFDQALRELVTERMVDEQPGHVLSYRVSHPLYAEVAYAELTGAERRAVHAALARAIDRTSPDDVLNLAPHYRAAGTLVDSGRAIEVLAAAGKRALGIGSSAEAVQYLQAAHHITKSADFPAALPDLLGDLARAFQGTGQLDEAALTLADGAAAARSQADAVQENLLRYRLALLISERGGSVLNIPDDRSWDSADTAQIWMVADLRHGTNEQLRATADRLIAFEKQTSAPAGRVVGGSGRSIHAMLDGDYHAALLATREGLAIAKQDGNPVVISGSARWLFMLSILGGELDEAIECISFGEAMKQQLQADLPSAISSIAERLALAHYLAGDLELALEQSLRGVEYAQRAGIVRSIGRGLRIRAFLLAERGDIGQAEKCIAEAHEVHKTDEDVMAVYSGLATIAIALQAGRACDLPPLEPHHLQFFHDPVAGCLRLMFGGFAYAANADLAGIQKIAGWLDDIGRTAPFASALADLQRGLALIAGGEFELAWPLLASAADRLAGMGMHFLSAQSRLFGAEVAPQEDAREAVKSCLAVFERAGAAPWLDRSRQLARKLGLRAPTTRKTGELTNREAQIAQLVGDGLSNRDIAARLFLSERTVETHLRNIYARLELPSRLALTRWATDNRPAG